MTRSAHTGVNWLMAAMACLLFGSMMSELRAADIGSGFEAANKLYEEGKFAAAADAYDKLISGGMVSAAIYFNQGNALFKTGQTGRAIAAYLQAQRLAPRDRDVRANLQLARSRARGGSPYQSDKWRDWLNTLSLNEWTLVTAAAVWALFILLALRQWKQELKESLRRFVHWPA